MKWSSHFTIFVLPLLFVAGARSDDKPDLQTIIDAWKAREQKAQSFDFRWWSKRHESRDANPPGVNPKRTDNVVRGNAIPKPENDSIWRYRFLADSGNRYLFEEFGHDWIPENGDFIPTHVEELFDGKSSKSFYDKGGFAHPILDVTENPTDHRIPKSGWTDPIKMAFRPFSLEAGMFDPKNLVLANETEMIDNHHVLVLGDENRRVWVDPAKDYLPVRWASTSGDFRADVSYQPDKIVGWVPHSWTIKRRHDSEIATVTQFAINKPIADSEFELDLSGGVILQNTSNQKTTLSIIYPDGKQRLLKPDEFDGKNFQELLKSEPASK